MSDISKITINGTEYNLKDEIARRGFVDIVIDDSMGEEQIDNIDDGAFGAYRIFSGYPPTFLYYIIQMKIDATGYTDPETGTSFGSSDGPLLFQTKIEPNGTISYRYSARSTVGIGAVRYSEWRSFATLDDVSKEVANALKNIDLEEYPTKEELQHEKHIRMWTPGSFYRSGDVVYAHCNNKNTDGVCDIVITCCEDHEAPNVEFPQDDPLFSRRWSFEPVMAMYDGFANHIPSTYATKAELNEHVDNSDIHMRFNNVDNPMLERFIDAPSELDKIRYAGIYTLANGNSSAYLIVTMRGNHTDSPNRTQFLIDADGSPYIRDGILNADNTVSWGEFKSLTSSNVTNTNNITIWEPNTT
ncbi:MAG: hypothetical protein IJY30_02170, partial [Muribaculaceae bacterium]|nr:hypothetical protein [Muribaculaceae bacterium]